MLHENWDPANAAAHTPKFISGYHKDGDAYAAGDKPLTPNDWDVLTADDVIRLHEGAQRREDPRNWSRGTQRHITTVYVDAISYDQATVRLYAAEIDRIILAVMPDTSTRLAKSGGSSSAVATFDRQALDWEAPADIPTGRRYYQMSGELGCVWQSA